MIIYLLTTIGHNLTNIESRAIGWFTEFHEPIDIVANNICDINEAGSYPYAVIEIVPPGLYPDAEELWFKWDGTKYISIPKPDEVKDIVNWGIG